MCKEMNAPVLPESKKVNATVTETYDLTADYAFHLTPDLISTLQMSRQNHTCLCQPSQPMTHYCCPGCRARTPLTPEDAADLAAILAGYNFNETTPHTLAEQLLDLVIRTLPLSLYTYAQSHHAPRGGVAALFVADVASAHRFAAHLAHACEDYYYHEEYLHTLYHAAMYDRDWGAVAAAHAVMGRQQAQANRLHRRIMMGYLGGGVGVGYVAPPPRGGPLVPVLGEDARVESCRAVCAVYLAGEGGKGGRFVAKRLLYVPHEPIVGEVVKWSSEWIGEEEGAEAEEGEEDEEEEV